MRNKTRRGGVWSRDAPIHSEGLGNRDAQGLGRNKNRDAHGLGKYAKIYPESSDMRDNVNLRESKKNDTGKSAYDALKTIFSPTRIN
jgi:hypothetical protein